MRMGPRRKLNVCKHDSFKAKRQKKCKDLAESHESNSVIKSDSESNPVLYLSRLPNEVLLCIYQYLSPADILSLTQLNDERLTNLTFSLRDANFSSCHRISQEHVCTYFSRFRVKWIQKLNFNYNIFVKPCDLVQIICRCKDLRELSVVECGIKYNHILNILHNCSKLEELAWNVGEVIQKQNVCYPSMKKIYLFCSIQEVSISVCYIIKVFSKIEDVFINFSSDLLVAPLIGTWVKSSCIPSYNVHRRCNVITNYFEYSSSDSDLMFLCKCIDEDLHNSGSTRQDNSVVHRLYNSSPYLQIKSMKEHVSLSSSVSTLTIILSYHFPEVFHSLIKYLSEVIGNKLKYLSIESEVYQSDEIPSYAEADMVCDMLEKISLTCKNITVLNLATVHFITNSPFKAICQLQNLRVLSISSCAFFKRCNSYSSELKCSNDQYCEFKEVVSACPKMEHFVLSCCEKNVERITENHIVPIKDWKVLKHITLYSIIFRSCSFLKKVADSCKQLESFSLITVAPNEACIFVNDIIYLLKNAKKLSFIRINEPRFNPMFERFWDAIGSAANLEGICILTRSNVFIDKQTVIKGIKKLKYLHLFHFSSPRASDRLYFDVKKSMQDHGVKNIKLEKDCCDSVGNITSSYSHEEPQFCCQRLHLQNVYI